MGEVILLAVGASVGVFSGFWLGVGVVRWAVERILGFGDVWPARISNERVAAIIPARNEEFGLPRCLAALTMILPSEQIFVASDGSTDRTVEVAKAAGCNVLDIQPNGGKANALARAIDAFQLCDRFDVVLIQDADSEVDPHYLIEGLPLFNDPNVMVVAGHVLSRWRSHRWPRGDLIFAAYRTRLYRIIQAVFQYGLSARWFSLSYIAPGFASMYRTRVLRQIDITAPGLAIEDFNMTFEVQRKRLGRIAYRPSVRCTSEDPLHFRDYRKQVQRWYLGFWQTVRRHGFWPSWFCLALVGLTLEIVVVALFTLALPVLVIAAITLDAPLPAFSIVGLEVRDVSPIGLLMVYLAVDYFLTAIVAVIDRRPMLLLYGFLFPFLRMVDAALFFYALGKSFFVRSDGRWKSPERFAGASAPIAQRVAEA